jgi:NitT/TauT family transport system substrate-binding protein
MKLARTISDVMPGLGPGIHVFLSSAVKTWMAGTSPAMTAVALIVLTTFAASPLRAAEPLAVNVGITNVIADVPLFIADKRGYFAAENLKVSFVPFDAAARMIGSLASGELEVGGGGISAGLFNAVARGLGVKIVADKSTSAAGLSTGSLMVRKDLIDVGRYKSPKDLKGWKVAVPAPGTGTSTSIDRLLQTVGLSIKDLDLTYLAFPQMLPAFLNKGIDAGFVTEPSLTAVVASGAAVPIARDDEMFPDHQIAVTLYSGRFIEKDRDAAVRFMRALLRGNRDYNDVVRDGRLAGPGADAIIAILTEYSLIKDPALYRRIGVHACDPDGKLNLASLETDLAYFVAQGLIQGKVDLAAAIDTSIAAAAVRSLGPYVKK